MPSSQEFHATTTPNKGGASVSHFQKTVRLLDWWLIRAENDSNGKTLAVAGLTSTPGQPVRVFSSAPIVKRHDVFTLETADGICVVLKGFINKLRTTDNGYTPQVFKHFVFGFPPNWDTHAANCFEGGGVSDSTAAGGNVSDTDNLPCTSKSATDADMNNCTLANLNSPLREISPSNGLDHGDSMAEERMQTTSANETPVPFASADVQDEVVENKGKKERESRKAKKKITFDSPGSGVSMKARGRKEKECLISPECRSYGRSRSGRVLLPTMEFWRNQLPVYDSDRKLRGIHEEQQEKNTTITTKRKEEHRRKSIGVKQKDS